MARPARQRRSRLWTVIVWGVLVVSSLVFLVAWPFVPSWLVPWWAFLYAPLVVVMVIALRRVERWWWSHSPWAWREVI